MRVFDYKKKKEIEVAQYNQRSLSFLYRTAVGRLLLKAITKSFLSKLCGKYNDSKYSKRKISSFVKKYHILLSDYEACEYHNFNEFFSRKLLPGKRKISKVAEDFISCCDSKVMIYPINDDLVFPVKQSNYSVCSILQDQDLAEKYKNGLCIVLRLTVDDYHRFCFLDDGVVEKTYHIPGRLHTVSPIVYDHYKVFHENSRQVSVLKTENFGTITQVEVGALMVGRIVNHPITNFKRGEEKGYFQFGGSTIVLFVEPNQVVIDPLFLEYSSYDVEVRVPLGTVLGKAVNSSKKVSKKRVKKKEAR